MMTRAVRKAVRKSPRNHAASTSTKPRVSSKYYKKDDKPKHWKEVMRGIEEMRKDKTAAVDTMGVDVRWSCLHISNLI